MSKDKNSFRTLSQHEAMDEILKFLVDNKGQVYFAYHIQQEVFPDQDQSIVVHLCKQIINTVDDIVEYGFDDFRQPWLKGNAITESYLKKGGFVAQNARERKEAFKEAQLKALQQEQIQEAIRSSRFSRKTSIIGLIISFIALIISLLALILK